MYPNQQQPGNQQGPPPQPQQGYPQPSNGGYGPQPQQTYEIDYLDKIAPQQAPPKFFSGAFGKIVTVLIVLFILGVSLIIAFSGNKNTASTEQIQTRLENTLRVATDFQPRIKSGALSENNSRWRLWMTDTEGGAANLLVQAEVKKTKYDKKMVAAEKQFRADLTQELEDAYLTGTFDRVYARKMGAIASELSTSLEKMSRKGPAKAFREYATAANSNIEPIKKSFLEFDETKD